MIVDVLVRMDVSTGDEQGSVPPALADSLFKDTVEALRKLLNDASALGIEGYGLAETLHVIAVEPNPRRAAVPSQPVDVNVAAGRKALPASSIPMHGAVPCLADEERPAPRKALGKIMYRPSKSEAAENESGGLLVEADASHVFIRRVGADGRPVPLTGIAIPKAYVQELGKLLLLTGVPNGEEESR